uniref:Plastid lipid-associated protein/fibrillin conserved domain-containing protein n=1 Tax=Chlamydomonas leiostraca TaxID=1034604 RepID=A0A7S0WPR3_9CHLO
MSKEFAQVQQPELRPLGSSPVPEAPPARALSPRPVPAAINSARQQIKAELLDIVQRLGIRAILPGAEQEKAAVDKLLEQLQDRDFSFHLRTDNLPQPSGSGRRPDPAPAVDARLFGTWELLYASNGTAVTRTGVAQAMISASSQLPGVGISGIRQTLALDPDGSITTTNEAVFGFGPLGSWSLAIDGAWRNTGDGKSVKVIFDKFKVKPVGLLGLQLPQWLPQVLISLGGDSAGGRGGADWVTTYLDDELRVGRGKSGNAFLFRRLLHS